MGGGGHSNAVQVCFSIYVSSIATSKKTIGAAKGSSSTAEPNSPKIARLFQAADELCRLSRLDNISGVDASIDGWMNQAYSRL